MFQTMQSIIEEITGKRISSPETDFVKDLSLSSFDIVNIIAAFEDHYHITIPTRDVWKIKQVKDAIAYLKAHGIQ